MSVNQGMNGTAQRKSLAAQLDRLDNTIDALADGLNDTIAHAIREAVTVAVQEAIQTVVTQVLNHPEILRRLAALEVSVPVATVSSTPDHPEPVKKTEGMGTKVGHAWGWLRTKVRNGAAWTCSKLPGLGHRVGNAGQAVWQHRYLVVMSVGIGLLVGSLGYLSGPVVSSLALGMCGAAASAAAFVLSPFVRLWQSLQSQQES
jgi:hypothetical protein